MASPVSVPAPVIQQNNAKKSSWCSFKGCCLIINFAILIAAIVSAFLIFQAYYIIQIKIGH
jgi:hypothetical protein